MITVKIGVIVASTDGLETTVRLYEQIIKPDINAYVKKLQRPTRARRPTPEAVIEFLIEDARGDDNNHLEMVQSFHAQGVNLIIGGAWSSQALGSLRYVNDNDMLLFSASSTNPGLAISGDNLFRMCPDDHKQAPAMAEMLVSKGIQAIIVIHRDDVYGNGLHDALRPAYEGKGGVVHTRIQYPIDQTDFTGIMTQAEAAAVSAVDTHGAEHVGVVLIGFSETLIIVGISQDYTTLYGLTWFGPETLGCNPDMLKENPIQACHLKLHSTLSAPENSSKFKEMDDRFEALTGLNMRYYTACQIDIAWVIATAMLETRRSDVQLKDATPRARADATPRARADATDVIRVIPDIASRYFGYSGWCLLNEAGDRAESDYDIWGYGKDETDEPSILKYGFYESMTGEIIWFIP